MKVLKKFREQLKKLLSLRNSNNQSEILTISKKFFKLLTEWSIFLLKSLFMKKDSLKYHSSLKKQQKRLLSCLKSLKYSSMSMKSSKNKPLESLQVLICKVTNINTNFSPKISKFNLISSLLNLENSELLTQPCKDKSPSQKDSLLNSNSSFSSQESLKYLRLLKKQFKLKKIES